MLNHCHNTSGGTTLSFLLRVSFYMLTLTSKREDVIVTLKRILDLLKLMPIKWTVSMKFPTSLCRIRDFSGNLFLKRVYRGIRAPRKD